MVYADDWEPTNPQMVFRTFDFNGNCTAPPRGTTWLVQLSSTAIEPPPATATGGQQGGGGEPRSHRFYVNGKGECEIAGLKVSQPRKTPLTHCLLGAAGLVDDGGVVIDGWLGASVVCAG